MLDHAQAERVVAYCHRAAAGNESPEGETELIEFLPGGLGVFKESDFLTLN